MNTLLTGQPGSGKTGWCYEYVNWLRSFGVSVGGVLSPGVHEAGTRIGFDLVDLLTGDEIVFAREKGKAHFEGVPVGAYTISDEGLAFGLNAIERAVHKPCDLVVIDEVGHLELDDGGLMPAVSVAWMSPVNTLIVVRSSLQDEVLSYFEQKEARSTCVVVRRG
ncbi:MAG: nucleoside-triphosphatase [Chloroflexota bacterium]